MLYCHGPHAPTEPHVWRTVKCQYCHELVAAQVTHPDIGRDGARTGMNGHWMTYCEDCDVWSSIPMLVKVE